MKEKFKQVQFSTLISISDENLFDLSKHIIIKRINSSRNPLDLKPVVIVADPFLFVHKDSLYVFYEEQKEISGKGIIKMIKTNDLHKWSEPIKVLEEGYHLSYPNVFEINGQIYMMPETGQNGTVQFYKPNNDLTEWKLSQVLLKGKNYVDSSIVYRDNHYFLFTTELNNGKYQLELYYSTEINGQWIKHPKSPLSDGSNTSRCGGSIFSYLDNLYRPVQYTKNKYGEGLALKRIRVLNTCEYDEEFIKQLIPNTIQIYKDGGHHFNYCVFNNKLVVATDILEYRINLAEIIKRGYNKII